MLDRLIEIPIQQVELGDLDWARRMIVIKPRPDGGRQWHYWVATPQGPSRRECGETLHVWRSLWNRICRWLAP